MPGSRRTAARGDGGFTLVELLVVMLIIGVLAAIALPAFLRQQNKGQDAAAKSDARNLVSHIESCFVDTEDYSLCVGSNIGNLDTTSLDIGTNPGQVTATAPPSGPASAGYEIDAYSKSGNHFYLTRVSNGTLSYTCTTAGQGGCRLGGVW